MTRRTLLGLPLASALSGTDLEPATLDLREPLARAAACIPHRMDPQLHYRPWFGVEVADGRPKRLHHNQWDFGDTTARFLEALILARQFMEPDRAALAAERRIREFLDSLFDQTGLVANPDLKGPDHMFSQGSVLYGLVTDFEDSRNPAVRRRIERLITALDRKAEHTGDYLWFSQVATKLGPCSHMAAYQVLPVVRFYELTGFVPALRYAERLSRWALDHDPTLTPDGVITMPGWEGHLHAWMDTFSGIVRCARARGSELDRRRVSTRAHRLFEWAKANYTSPFGWVADSVGSKTCETDTITSAIRLALELIKEGHAGYWDDIERFVRNQLVENQFRDVTRLGLRDPALERGIAGCFESYADPTTLLAVRNGDIEGCCINGGMRGLFLALQNAIHDTPEEIRVNLLLSAASPGLSVTSYLPFEGRLELRPAVSKPIRVRMPSWLSQEKVRVDGPAGLRVETPSGSILITRAGAGSTIVLRFDQPEQRRTHIVAGRSYKALWRGDTVLELLPRGGTYPIFERASLRASVVPLRRKDRLPREQRVHW